MTNLLIGRFPLYINHNFPNEQEKWGYFLSLIREANEGLYQFICNAPNGTLRILGLYQKRKVQMFYCMFSIPTFVRSATFFLPKRIRSKVSTDDPYTEIVSINELFQKTATYHIISDDIINLSKTAKEFEQFIGVSIQPKYIPIEYRVIRGKRHHVFKALNSETGALVKFLRLTGIGEKKSVSNKDVLVYAIE